MVRQKLDDHLLSLMVDWITFKILSNSGISWLSGDNDVVSALCQVTWLLFFFWFSQTEMAVTIIFPYTMINLCPSVRLAISIIKISYLYNVQRYVKDVAKISFPKVWNSFDELYNLK